MSLHRKVARVSSSKLLVVGIGGAARPDSSTDRALGIVLRACAGFGAATLCFGGEYLAALPYYVRGRELTDVQQGLLSALSRADGVILASPNYHGNVSGLLKNALDTLDELRDDARPYLDQRAVGCVVTTHVRHTGEHVLAALHGSVHSLRGITTSYSAVLNTLETSLTDARAEEALSRVGRQVVEIGLARWEA